MHDIAAHAGVGTAYRRFANKQEVIDALCEQRLDKVAALADEALEDPDAWRGLCTYLERVLMLQSQDRGLTDISTTPTLGRSAPTRHATGSPPAPSARRPRAPARPSAPRLRR